MTNINIDLDFVIPHEKLSQIFEEYRIRTEWVAQIIDNAQIYNIPILQQFISQEKYLIGITFLGLLPHNNIEYTVADFPILFACLSKDFDELTNQGSAILPHGNSLEIINNMPPAVFPTNIPVVIHPFGLYEDSVGAFHPWNGSLKAILNTVVESGSRLYISATSNTAYTSALFVALVFAEGKKRSK